ncbi:MAG: Xanthine dehydrogenase, FAD binding subunit, partial [uncultured Rubrobacteraceae bacterium]
GVCPAPEHARGARSQERAPRGRADPGRHRRHGRVELRPQPARRGPRPLPRGGAGGVGNRGRAPAGRRRGELHAHHRGDRGPPAGALDGLEDGGLAPDPEQGHRRRQPRHRLPRRRRAPPPVRLRRRGRGRLRRRKPEDTRRGLRPRPEAERPGPQRVDLGLLRGPRRRPAAVLQDRDAQRHGDRGLRLRPSPPPRTRPGRGVHRIRRTDPHPGGRGRALRAGRDGRTWIVGIAGRHPVRRAPAFRGAGGGGGEAHRRRSRDGRVPAALGRGAGAARARLGVGRVPGGRECGL